MKIYSVGGSVRDAVLGKESKDRDFVVVGSSPDEMINLGFAQVGKDFPVFLHPTTKEEYALARKERRIDSKNWSFELNASLEEDLIRRDFTCNALALPTNNNPINTVVKVDDKIIDFFGGLQDIQKKELKMVSDHFWEDPLRMMRGARFAARYNWNLEQKTFNTFVENNKNILEIPIERIWLEINKAISEKNDLNKFWNVLEDTKILGLYFSNRQMVGKNIGNNILERVILSFSGETEKDIKKIVLEKDQQHLIFIAQSLDELKSYQHATPSDRLKFIKKTRATSDVNQSGLRVMEVVDNASTEIFKKDLDGLRNFDWSSLNNDGKKIQEKQIEILASTKNFKLLKL